MAIITSLLAGRCETTTAEGGRPEGSSRVAVAEDDRRDRAECSSRERENRQHMSDGGIPEKTESTCWTLVSLRNSPCLRRRQLTCRLLVLILSRLAGEATGGPDNLLVGLLAC